MFSIPEICQNAVTDADKYSCSLQLSIDASNRSTVAFFFSVAMAIVTIWLSLRLARKANKADRQIVLLNLGFEIRQKVGAMRRRALNFWNLDSVGAQAEFSAWEADVGFFNNTMSEFVDAGEYVGSKSGGQLEQELLSKLGTFCRSIAGDGNERSLFSETPLRSTHTHIREIEKSAFDLQTAVQKWSVQSLV